jgi:hypothetical protein
MTLNTTKTIGNVQHNNFIINTHYIFDYVFYKIILRSIIIAKRNEQHNMFCKLKSDWGTLVPRINVENGMKLGSVWE